MNNQYLKLMNDTFGDLNDLTTEKLEAFQKAVLREAFTLRSLVESENPEKQAEGMERGLALKALIEAKKESLYKMLGLTPEEVKIVAKQIAEKNKKKATNKNKNIINLIG